MNKPNNDPASDAQREALIFELEATNAATPPAAIESDTTSAGACRREEQAESAERAT